MLNKCIRRYFFYLSPRPPLGKKNAWSQVDRRQVSEAQREKERRRDKEPFLLEEQHKFTAAVRKWEMLEATKEKLSGSEKVNKNMYDISSI